MLIALTAALGIGFAATASGQSPPDGSTFTTTDTVRFEHPAAAAGDRAYFFSTSPDIATAGGFGFGQEKATSVDLGWLAEKFDHLGAFYWAACTMVVDENGYEQIADCTAPLSFSVRFRFATLTVSTAKAQARTVMRRKSDIWRAGYGRRLKCHRLTRVRRRCSVSAIAGDVVVYGNVWLYPKRKRTYEVARFRVVLKIFDEYCYSVLGKPESECTRTRRSRGSVY
jgi:hypothetical protein